MSKMQSLNITLPADLARWIEKKVASGEYATESDVVADSLRDAVAEDAAIDQWVTDEVLPTLDRLDAGLEKTFTVDEVRERLNARMQTLTAKHS